MEDEIVFLQPFNGVRLDDGGSGTLEFLLNDAGGEAFEVGVPDPAAGELNELVPFAGEGKFKHHAYYAIVEILDFPLQALATLEDEWLEGLFHGRTLKADVAGSHVLEAGIDGTSAEDAAKPVEANLFADVELNHDQNGPTKGCVVRFGRDQRG